MKRLTSIFPAFALTLLFAGTAFGQGNSQAFNANAQVLAPIQTAEEVQTDWGIVANDFAGSNPSLDPSDGTVTNTEGGTPQVGFVSVSGTAAQTVDITVATTFQITESGAGTDQIDVNPLFNWTPDNLTAAGSPTNAQIANTGADFSMVLSSDGTNTILIGGTLSHNTVAPIASGTYTGSATITIAYQ